MNPSGQEPSEIKGRPLPKLTGDPQKTITMATIAKAAGVSQGAISSLLNDRDYGIRVSDKTRDRVFKVCRELGYVPNDLRAVVRMYPEMGDLCLLAPSDWPSVSTHPFLSRVLDAATTALDASKQHITLARFDPKADCLADPESLPSPIQMGIASKFISVGPQNPSLLQALNRRGFPVAVLGSEITSPGVTSFLPDFAQASRVAIEYLLKLGHQRIAILSGPFGTADFEIIEFNRGVRVAYDQAGLSIDAQNIIYGDLTFENGFKALDTIFSRSPQPTAAFCLSDTAAVGLLSAAQSRQLDPAALSIIGCGDDPVSALLGLTTIHLPAEEMAAAAVTELNARLQEPDLGDPRKIVSPVRLVERASCAAPAK